jgi:hypothetical protein
MFFWLWSYLAKIVQVKTLHEVLLLLSTNSDTCLGVISTKRYDCHYSVCAAV